MTYPAVLRQLGECPVHRYAVVRRLGTRGDQIIETGDSLKAMREAAENARSLENRRQFRVTRDTPTDACYVIADTKRKTVVEELQES